MATIIGGPGDWDECGATGQSCSYRPDGPNGEMQCQYCGKEKPAASVQHSSVVRVGAAAPIQPRRKPAKERYDAAMHEGDEPSALERLRFFCSLAMDGQDWLDAEPFFDALAGDSRDAAMLRWAIKSFRNADHLAALVLQHEGGNPEGLRIDIESAAEG